MCAATLFFENKVKLSYICIRNRKKSFHREREPVGPVVLWEWWALEESWKLSNFYSLKESLKSERNFIPRCKVGEWVESKNVSEDMVVKGLRTRESISSCILYGHHLLQYWQSLDEHFTWKLVALFYKLSTDSLMKKLMPLPPFLVLSPLCSETFAKVKS